MGVGDRVGLLSVGTANPEHVLEQARAKQFAAGFFAGQAEGLAASLASFDNAGIATRQLGRPIEWLEQARSFPEKNAAYVEQALQISERAALRAIEQAGIPRAEFGAIVFATSTGIATPSLDARLVQSLGLSRAIARVPLWGLGCGGGGPGSRGRPRSRAGSVSRSC